MISRSGRVHGAAFDIDGCGVVAIGRRGSGNSTLTAAALRSDASVVEDDLLLAAPDGTVGRLLDSDGGD